MVSLEHAGIAFLMVVVAGLATCSWAMFGNAIFLTVVAAKVSSA